MSTTYDQVARALVRLHPEVPYTADEITDIALKVNRCTRLTSHALAHAEARRVPVVSVARATVAVDTPCPEDDELAALARLIDLAGVRALGRRCGLDTTLIDSMEARLTLHATFADMAEIQGCAVSTAYDRYARAVRQVKWLSSRQPYALLPLVLHQVFGHQEDSWWPRFARGIEASRVLRSRV